jgi:hypothetical protein
MELQAHQAYLLGFTPQLLGVFFNGLLVLERVRRTAQGQLANRVEWYLRDWVPSRGDDVVSNVHLVEGMLGAVGKTAGEPPQTIEAYYDWSERVNKATYQAAKAAFDVEADPVAKTARFRVRLAQDLGQQVGDIVHTVNLASLVQALLHDDPEHEFLRAQAGRLAESQRAIIAQLDKVLTYTAGYEDIQAEVRRLAAALRAGPDAGATENHALVATKLQALLPALDLTAVEKLFMTAS